MLATVLDVLGFIAIIAVCIGLLFLGSRIEPHWVSRDSQRFTATAVDLDHHGVPASRKREVRVAVDDDTATLFLSKRAMLRPDTGRWRVVGRYAIEAKRRAVFEIERVDIPAIDTRKRGADIVIRKALRLPESSRMVNVLDAMTGAAAD